MGNTIYVQGSYIDIHDNEVVNLTVDKAEVRMDTGPGSRKEGSGEAARQEKPAEEKPPLNYFAPTRNLQELLRGAWFRKVRSSEAYDEAWTDAFVEALMASEWRDLIAGDWASEGIRSKVRQIKGHVAGLLKDNGILLGSYDRIARAAGITEDPRSFSRYMGEGKRQPYAPWVRQWIRGSG